CAVGLGDADDFVQFVLKLHLLTEGGDAALEAQQPHGDLPAVTRLADNIRSNGVVEEHLVEFGGASQLLDRPYGDARLVHGHQEEAQPAMGLGIGVGAGDDEAPVGLVGQGGPDLLAVDAPLPVRVLLGAGAHIGQVGTGARLGVALAPEFGAGADARQVTLFLVFAAEGDQGRAGQAFADVAYPAGATGTGVFLEKDHLLFDGSAAAAVFRWPADTGPAASSQVLLPAFALGGEHMLVAGAAAEFQLGKFAGEVIA